MRDEVREWPRYRRPVAAAIMFAAGLGCAAPAVAQSAAPQSAAPQSATPDAPAVAAEPPAAASATMAVAAPNINIPPRPQEPRAAKTYAVLEAHCARCHQSGKTEKPIASGGVANVLAVDELARDPRLVRPGLPDASRLYDILVTRHAPLDVYTHASEDAEPRPDDIETVRDWIKDIQPSAQSCASRTPVAQSDIDGQIRDAQRIAGPDAKDLRFVSLAYVYNACATAEEMSAYRQALTKLLNGLSWSSDVASLTTYEPTGSLVSFRLSEVGWVAGHWELVQRAYPKTLAREIPADIRSASGVAIPIINGDWLASAISDTPLYYALLGLPLKLADLAKMSGVDIEQSIKSMSARRVVVRASEITRGNRLIERHPGGRGGFWLAYDFATSTGDQDLFEHPLGAKATAAVKAPFKPDQVRVMFPLPNGFYAYAIFDAAGNRIDRVLPGIEKQYAGIGASLSEPSTKAGGSCLSCHIDGIKSVRDEFRSYAAPEISPLAKDVRDAALPLFSSDSELALLISADAERNHRALAAAGLDPSLTLHGEELVWALANRYRGEADIKAASAESGIPVESILAELTQAKGAAVPLVRRLQQGVLPRADLDRLYGLLKGIDAPAEITSAGGFLRDVKTEIGLSLWIDRPRPAAGDLVVVKAEADSDCYLTVVSVDGEGKATVLFPNDFEPDNLVTAGSTVNVPAANSPYQLRFKADGTETLLARCSASPVPPTGIEHDFERQRFTLLGNWENFIQDTLASDAELRRNPEKAERARAAKEQAMRRRQGRSDTPEERPNTSPGAALRDGRAVLIIGNG